MELVAATGSEGGGGSPRAMLQGTRTSYATPNRQRPSAGLQSGADLRRYLQCGESIPSRNSADFGAVLFSATEDLWGSQR